MWRLVAAMACGAVPAWLSQAELGLYAGEARAAAEVALRCGAAMRSTLAVAHAATLKDGEGGGIDPVTQTDRDNEALVALELSARFPGYALVGEEAASAAGHIPSIDPATPTWVVDPIDGTQNFVHSLPLSCVSIGLAVNAKPVLGVVYDPYREELFVGVAELAADSGAPGATGFRAAYLNGVPIRADASVTTLDKAIVGTDAGYERSPQGIARLAGAHAALLSQNVFALRILGSTVLSVAYLACGRANGFYSGLAKRDCPKPWDWCAAAALGEASGVAFRRFDADTGFDFQAPSGLCCACSNELADTLEATLREVTGGKPMP